MCKRAILLSILVLHLALACSVAGASGPPKQKKAAAPASSAIPDFVLRLTNNYCDTALPYLYRDDPNAPTLQLWPKNKVKDAIFSTYGKVYGVIGAGFFASDSDPVLTSGLANEVDDPIIWSRHPLAFTDPGGPILGQADLELGPDGYDAARLLVRTLQPSVVANACNRNANSSSSTGGLILPHQTKGDSFSFSQAAYYLIDIVRWETVQSNGQSTNQAASDHWYLFNFSDAKASHRKAPFTFRPFVTSDLRIFGDAKHPAKTKVVFLAIHLAPQGSSTETVPKKGQAPDQQKWFDNVDISYKLHADKVVPANIQDLQLLVNFIVGKATIPGPKTEEVAPPAFQGLYGAGLVTNLRDLPAKVTSTMTATFTGPPDQPKAPAYCANVEKNLLSSSGNNVPACPDPSKNPDATSPVGGSTTFNSAMAGEDQMSFPAEPSFSTNGHGKFLSASYLSAHLYEQAAADTSGLQSADNPPAATNVGNPSPTVNQPQPTAPSANCDSSTTTDAVTKKTTQKPCTLTQTITDEGLYHWDVSVAVPITGYKETVFDTNNALTPKSVTRTNAYAMIDIAPWGEDFVKPALFGIPHLMTGLPLSGKVFNKPFVGGLGEEVGLSKVFPFSARIFAGVVYNKEFRGASQQPHRVWKIQYGIEMSMSSAISKLKGSSTPKTSTSGTGATN